MGSSSSRSSPRAAEQPRILTRPLDRWVNQVRFSADGQWIYFSYEQLGGVDIGRVRVADGKLETVLAGQRQILASSMSRATA